MFVDDQPQTVPNTQPEISTLFQAAAAVPLSLTWLSPAEAAYLQTLKIEKRRQDWLLGRWTAKMLVVNFIAAKTSRHADPATITIHKDADGAPRVEIAGANPSGLTLSLSHSHGFGAAAIVSRPDWPLGIDLERLAPRHPAFVTDYFTEQEQAQMQGLAPDRYVVAVNALWSGKEAALKAVRQGLTQDTRAVNCAFDFSAMPSEQWSPFDVTWDPVRVLGRLPTLIGLWRIDDDFVGTIVAKSAP